MFFFHVFTVSLHFVFFLGFSAGQARGAAAARPRVATDPQHQTWRRKAAGKSGKMKETEKRRKMKDTKEMKEMSVKNVKKKKNKKIIKTLAKTKKKKTGHQRGNATVGATVRHGS